MLKFIYSLNCSTEGFIASTLETCIEKALSYTVHNPQDVRKSKAQDERKYR